MLQIILICLILISSSSILLINGEDGSFSIRESTNDYESPETELNSKSDESEEEEEEENKIKRFPPWDLNILNRQLMRFLVMKCPSINLEEATAFREFLNQQFKKYPGGNNNNFDRELVDNLKRTENGLKLCLKLDHLFKRNSKSNSNKKKSFPHSHSQVPQQQSEKTEAQKPLRKNYYNSKMEENRNGPKISDFYFNNNDEFRRPKGQNLKLLNKMGLNVGELRNLANLNEFVKAKATDDDGNERKNENKNNNKDLLLNSIRSHSDNIIGRDNKKSPNFHQTYSSTLPLFQKKVLPESREGERGRRIKRFKEFSSTLSNTNNPLQPHYDLSVSKKLFRNFFHNVTHIIKSTCPSDLEIDNELIEDIVESTVEFVSADTNLFQFQNLINFYLNKAGWINQLNECSTIKGREFNYFDFAH